VVHCEFERDYYANELKVPVAKIESVPWYFEEAEVASTPRIDGPYLCAVGASMRDYGTLFEAMRQLPELRLAAVVRPENLVGLEVPDNVMVFKDIAKAELWNIQYHSVMHVLPLARSARTGHACLTQAMYFARPNLVADVPCVADYVSPGRTAEMYRPGDPDDLAGAIQRLWYDDSARARLGDAAREHALEHFSQRAMGDFLEDLVQRLSPM
jgi:glycosyltransferase involved in cell wall biosynthesis